MSIDVLMKQKLFGNKTMPLEVILGEHLHYGNFEDDHLHVGELGDSEIVVYDPQHIGRGFSVVWNPKEKKRISLRLPQPTTTEELTDFYAAVQRMARHWDTKLNVDGSKMTVEAFMAGFADMVKFNDKITKQFSQSIIDGEHETLTLYSAMWPLSIGKEEAVLFMEDPDRYAKWLHEKQSMDVQFAAPGFYAEDEGIVARFILKNGMPATFPYQPTVPFGMVDLATGKQLECAKWLILIGIDGDEAPLCEMEYGKFLDTIPEDKKSKYDACRFLLAEMSEEEIRALCAKATQETV